MPYNKTNSTARSMHRKLQLVHPGRSNLQAMVLLPTIGFDVSAIDLDYLDRVVGTNKGR